MQCFTTSGNHTKHNYTYHHRLKMKSCRKDMGSVKIVYNRVPKTASRTIEDVFTALAAKGEFNLTKSHVYLHYKLSQVEQVCYSISAVD